MNSEDKLGLKRELKILKESKHPFIIKFKEKFLKNEKICVVTEYASRGDLENLMKK